MPRSTAVADEQGSTQCALSRSAGQRQFAADVEQNVGFARGDCFRVCGSNCLIVKVEPLLFVDRVGGIVSGASSVEQMTLFLS